MKKLPCLIAILLWLVTIQILEVMKLEMAH